MGRETRLFKSEERRSRSEVSQFLHQVADKIEKTPCFTSRRGRADTGISNQPHA
jgi:hypothetical protein